MIAFLDGTLVEKQPTHVILDVGGIGYEVSIPLSSFDRLPAAGDRCRLLTHHHVREDAHQLFGFVTPVERQLFELLISVSGIGPKLGLSALSGLSVREIKAAIVGGDSKRLSSISGIGKKTAERMILELRDKFSAGEALEALAGPEERSTEDQKSRDAIAALIALGYRQDEARKMVLAARRALPEDSVTVESLIKKSLSA